MQPAQSQTQPSPVQSPSSSRRKQQTSSQNQVNLKHQKKQPSRRNCAHPPQLTLQEASDPSNGKTVAETAATKKNAILKRGDRDPVTNLNAAPSEVEVTNNTQKGPKGSRRRRKDCAKNSVFAWSEPLTGDETSTTAPPKSLKTSRSEPNFLSDKAHAEFKRSNSAELPPSRYDAALLTGGNTKQQKDERSNRKDYGSSSPRATPRKDRRGDRRKNDTASVILNSELDAMNYIANQPPARFGESSDSDALASSPPVHSEHGWDFPLSSLVNSSPNSNPTTKATHNNNNHKAVMLKQYGGNKAVMLYSKTSGPNLHFAENNTNKSTSRRRNNAKSAHVHESSTKFFSTSVPESNSGLMRSPLANVTSMQQMGSATPSKQQRRRELFSVTTMPGVTTEQAHSGGTSFIQRRRSVSSVDDHTEDLSMMSPTRPKSQLYAGPTFHNSPAPSSLPVPAFMK